MDGTPLLVGAVQLDMAMMLGGLAVGFCVGLTGMGGGALMTPMLVLVFGVDPLTAVSSDLVASVFMKPVGGSVHLRRGTVHLGIVRWLMLGSIPAAFSGVLILRALGDNASDRLEPMLGVALLVASTAMVWRARLARQRGVTPLAASDVAVRAVATLTIGVVGGVIVGLTSVGSGSLVMVLLVAAYPRLDIRTLVGTDLVQAVPLVATAALGHVLFGDVQLSVTTSLLIGALPATYVGARLSSRANEGWIRPVLVAVLIASGVKLLGAPASLAAVIGAVACTVAVVTMRKPAKEAPELAPAAVRS